MKNILLLTCLFITSVSFGQTIQASLKAGSQPNTVMVVMKPSAAMVDAQLTTLYFAIAIPASVVPQPTVTIKENFISGMEYASEVVPGTEMINGVAHYVYNFGGDGGANPTKRTFAAEDFNVAEVLINGGPLEGTSEVKLVTLPNGGKTINSLWNIWNLGDDVTNTTTMFFGAGSVNSASGYSGLSFAPLANITLPVEFKAFYAMKSGDDARLSWDVSSDEKNSHFEVLRSTDGRNFQTIQRVNALQNGRSDNSYQTVDLSLSKLNSREVFYQINQTDKDGAQTKSPVRKLSVDGLGKAVTAFPNPARTTTKLVVDAPEAGRGSIILRDALGRQMQNISAQFNKGINQFDIKLMNMSAGDYNISVMGAGLNETIKLTKVN